MSTSQINLNALGFNNGFMNIPACNQPKMITLQFNQDNTDPNGDLFIDYQFDMAPIIDQGKIDFIQGMIILWEGNTVEDSNELSVSVDFGNGLVYRTKALLYNQGVEMHRPVQVNNPPNIKIRLTNTGVTPIISPATLTILFLNVPIQPHDATHDYPAGF